MTSLPWRPCEPRATRSSPPSDSGVAIQTAWRVILMVKCRFNSAASSVGLFLGKER
jgi:hypothetical protein